MLRASLDSAGLFHRDTRQHIDESWLGDDYWQKFGLEHSNSSGYLSSGPSVGARLEAFRFPHPRFFTWPLGYSARLLYCIWSEFAFPDFVLHRLQHLPATILAEKRSDAAHGPRFLFYEEAAFGEHIISPRYFTTGEYRSRSTGSSMVASRSYAGSCTKAKGFRFH
jgi:hypothetical protein